MSERHDMLQVRTSWCYYFFTYTVQNAKINENLDWKSDYAYGCDHEIYTVMISSEFDGMTFPEAAE